MKLEFLEAGEIVSTHGVRGEMKVLPWADGPDFLCEFDRVRIAGKDYPVESCRVQKTCNLLKIEGVDTMEAAQAMRGKTVEIYRCDAPEGLIFAAELMGMTVLCEGEEIGKITDVLDYPGNKVYVVKGQKEYMIPAVKAFILDTDMEKEIMQVRLIEGMETDAH
ncbi:MAG: 16S rRNA processing protein RimM [Oscillospiraceae bacterium]|nr:16S rRNA processing protein RimM [Oscillospiraceae bacterium]